jgi:hypothetical protein
MKKRLTWLAGAMMLSAFVFAGGCAVRTVGPGPVVASIRTPGLVVVDPTPAVRVKTRTSYRKRCRRYCTPSRCYTRCRKVVYAYR